VACRVSLLTLEKKERQLVLPSQTKKRQKYLSDEEVFSSA
jgi:hypothetical protein